MDQGRPWQTDAELEAQMSSQSRRVGYESKPLTSTPRATYWILGVIGVTFLLERLTILSEGDDPRLFYYLWTIYTENAWYDWLYRPWSPITATFAHSPNGFTHILFNSIGLFFFGPMLEQVVGRLRFVSLVILTGALSSVAQASIDHLWDPPGGPALGASGAIMALIGVAILINPKAKIFLFFVPIPIPLWVAGIIFAAIDVVGAAVGGSGVGNFAHLSGLAIGLIYGFSVKKEMKAKGIHFVSH